MRLFLAIWIGVFSMQGAELLVLLAPDDCLELTTDGSAGDPCPDTETCARCVCCARGATSVSSDVVPAPLNRPPMVASLPAFDFPASAEPRGILHVPKTV